MTPEQQANLISMGGSKAKEKQYFNDNGLLMIGKEDANTGLLIKSKTDRPGEDITEKVMGRIKQLSNDYNSRDITQATKAVERSHTIMTQLLDKAKGESGPGDCHPAHQVGARNRSPEIQR